MKNLVKVFAGISVILLFSSCVSNKSSSANLNVIEDVLFEGFNESTEWKAVGKNWGDGDCSTVAEISTKWSSEGTASLECEFEKTGTDAHATYCVEQFNIADFSDFVAASFDVNNTLTVPIQVALAITTGEGWEWYESGLFDIPVGESKGLRVDFYSNSLKSAVSNWEFTGNLGDANDVRRVAVKFMLPEGVEGKLYIDNLMLLGK